jgi:hypothetical protein
MAPQSERALLPRPAPRLRGSVAGGRVCAVLGRGQDRAASGLEDAALARAPSRSDGRRDFEIVGPRPARQTTTSAVFVVTVCRTIPCSRCMASRSGRSEERDATLLQSGVALGMLRTLELVMQGKLEGDETGKEASTCHAQHWIRRRSERFWTHGP